MEDVPSLVAIRSREDLVAPFHESGLEEAKGNRLVVSNQYLHGLTSEQTAVKTGRKRSSSLSKAEAAARAASRLPARAESSAFSAAVAAAEAAKFPTAPFIL